MFIEIDAQAFLRVPQMHGAPKFKDCIATRRQTVVILLDVLVTPCKLVLWLRSSLLSQMFVCAPRARVLVEITGPRAHVIDARVVCG